uniref:C2H2-type domain-containing protein n=1 Tax=Anopheles farauti TaxID=69004 RepID=A0A182QZL6_9DIPT
MVGRKTTTTRSGGGVVKKEEILMNVQLNGDDEIDLVPVNKETEYGSASGEEDRDGDEDEEMSDHPDSDPELLETADGRLVLDIKRSKCCGKCKKVLKTSSQMRAHKSECTGVVDSVQEAIKQERKAAKYANPSEEFHKYCNPNPDNPCYCCGEDITTAHVGHIRCQFCPKSFKAYEYLDRHISSIHSESDAFACCYCNAKCSTQQILDEHLKTHDEGKPYACMACGKDFTRRYHLDRHEKHTNCGMVPKEVEVMPCEVCGKQFTRIDNLREHLRSHMGQGARKRDYQCPYCVKSFYGSSLLNIHIRTHTGEKPFPCDLCPMSFPSTGALRKHRRKHTGERPYRCDECSAMFAARETLNRHRMTHTGERPHECQQCGKRFIQATQLRTHMATHTGENAFECKECDAKFNRKARLTEHVRFMHKGEQPFSCSTCSKMFLRRDDLVRHELIHSDVKPFECTTCGKHFTTKTAINLHQRTHQEDAQAQCKVCSKVFKRSDCLLRHMRSKHREYLDQIIDDTEKAKMEQLMAKRVAEKEATVEIDGAVYQITTMEESQAAKELEVEQNQTVEVFEVLEVPTNAPEAPPIAIIPTTSVPYELLPITEDTEVIISEEGDVEFLEKSAPSLVQSIVDLGKAKKETIVPVDASKKVQTPIAIPAKPIVVPAGRRSPPVVLDKPPPSIVGRRSPPVILQKPVTPVAAPKATVSVKSATSSGESPKQSISSPKPSGSGLVQQKLDIMLNRPVPKHTINGAEKKSSTVQPKPERKETKEQSVKQVKPQVTVSSTAKAQEVKLKPQRVVQKEPAKLADESKPKRKRAEPKPSPPAAGKRVRVEDDSIPIFLSDDMLERKISELLQMLMGDDMLRSFGWPDRPVEEVLGRVIIGCGHQPTKGEEAGDHTTRMRENTKILFSVTMDDEHIKALLNNHTVDEVIMHVLKNK